MTELIERLRKAGDNRGGTIYVATHDGRRWHADECLAIAVLMCALPKYKFAVSRSRDPAMWSAADIVIDVGGTTNPFDHHGPIRKRHPNGVPYAACGLILDAVEEDRELRTQLYNDLFYAVEVADNGEEARCGNYRTSLLAWVPVFSSTYEETEDTTGFYKTIDMCLDIYKRVRSHAVARLHARDKLPKIEVVHGFMRLPSRGFPWRAWASKMTDILGAFHTDENGVCRVKAANEYGSSFTKFSFPTSWCGKSDEALQTASNNKGAVYCSDTGNMMVFRTEEYAMRAIRTVNSLYKMNH